jgi:glycogen debranching enzyme
MLARLIRQARLDLESLMFHFDRGFVPAAGLPWFVAIFGRDSLITALEVLPVLPELARGVLSVLGEFQAERDDPERDAEPGKIPHEIRLGERALLGDLPFAPYYGSVDATPLFVMLLGEYLKVTKDWAFLAQMAGKLRSALDWILQSLQADQGFLYYQRRAAKGLENQGWKDSTEAVCFCDGRVVRGRPIALVEVQGYAYAALQAGAALLKRLGEREEAARLQYEAEELKRRFNREFWLEREGYFALALAEGLGLVDAITSNPGHGLLTGIIEEEYIPKVVQRLLSPELLSGFGIRTMATTCASYDPLSYHNGSVWPHDNALILLGLLRLGFVREARQVAQGLLEAARHFEGQLPELFGGFSREEAPEPSPYPRACVPQAWAAGAAFVLLRVLHPHGQNQEQDAV